MSRFPLDRFLAFRFDLASRAAALSFTSNFSLMILKLVVGILTGSIAVLSDAVDSGEDAIASSFAFLTIRLAARPADEDHPYGHGKAESLAAGGQAILIAGGGGFIMYQAVRRLIERDVEIDTPPGLIAMAVTALVNVAVLFYVARAARITGSVALRADARHLWTNIVQAGAVILALGLVGLTGHTLFDPIVALLLATFLLVTAGQVFTAGLAEIMDVRLPQQEELLVRACLEEFEGVGARGYHRLRSRKAGRQRYVDFHLLVDPKETVAAAHALCDALEEAIQARLQGAVVTVHLEPDDGRPRDRSHEQHVRMGSGGHDDSPKREE